MHKKNNSMKSRSTKSLLPNSTFWRTNSSLVSRWMSRVSRMKLLSLLCPTSNPSSTFQTSSSTRSETEARLPACEKQLLSKFIKYLKLFKKLSKANKNFFSHKLHSGLARSLSELRLSLYQRWSLSCWLAHWDGFSHTGTSPCWRLPRNRWIEGCIRRSKPALYSTSHTSAWLSLFLCGR